MELINVSLSLLGLDDQHVIKAAEERKRIGRDISSLDIWDANTAKKHWFCSGVFRLVLFNLVIYLIKEKTSF